MVIELSDVKRRSYMSNVSPAPPAAPPEQPPFKRIVVFGNLAGR
jgi:hypothetical protein